MKVGKLNFDPGSDGAPSGSPVEHANTSPCKFGAAFSLVGSVGSVSLDEGLWDGPASFTFWWWELLLFLLDALLDIVNVPSRDSGGLVGRASGAKILS